MAVELVKSTPVSNADATPVVFNNARVSGARMKQDVGFAPVANAASIASVYRLCRVPSSATALNVFLTHDAFTTTGAGDVGIYNTQKADGTAGTVVDADFFASAVVLTAAQSEVNVTHESGVYPANAIEKPLWQALGLAADPMVQYDVAITLTTANGAGTANVAARVQYTV